MFKQKNIIDNNPILLPNYFMKEQAILDIVVSPKSSQSRITMDDANTIKVYLTSPPVDGRANSELLKLLSKQLNIAKSYIDIQKGEHGKKKRIIIYGMSMDDVLLKLKEPL